MQVSDHAANLGYIAPGSVQFPSLIGLPTQCLLPIIAESQHRQAHWQDGGPQLDRSRRTSGQKIDWAGILNCSFTGFVRLLSVVEWVKKYSTTSKNVCLCKHNFYDSWSRYALFNYFVSWVVVYTNASYFRS